MQAKVHKRPQMHQDRGRKPFLSSWANWGSKKEAHVCHLSFMDQDSRSKRRGHPKKAHRPMQKQKKSGGTSSFAQATLSAHAVPDECPQQLKGSISIRKPFLLRAAFRNELEQQPAICFLRQNNNESSLSQGNRQERKQVHPTSTVWGQKTIIQLTEVPSNSNFKVLYSNINYASISHSHPLTIIY